ncbi:SRPBCC domain-containing protein [Streptomyces rimosus]|uniref:SRPBCC domain-containing protein n=1 Tax=Streptomyces rimosus TaxID=1927 RepID=UPI0037885FFF
MDSGYVDQGSDIRPSSAGAAPQRAVHGSFSLSRDFSVPPARVFAAFAEPALRTRWFRMPARREDVHHELDFRIGGSELARATTGVSGVEEHLEYRSRFLDIVPGTRIVSVYETYVDHVRRWVSLTTVELAERPDGCRLEWTEQYAFLVATAGGGQDVAHLRGSAQLLLNGLSTVVEPHLYGHLGTQDRTAP